MTDADLERFLSTYIRTALWAETDESTPEGGEPLYKNYDAGDLDPEALARMRLDCRRFLEENEHDIGDRTDDAGHDFWLTRNGHGAGFWDGDWPEPAASRLTAACKRFGEVGLYVGDAGRIHCS